MTIPSFILPNISVFTVCYAFLIFFYLIWLLVISKIDISNMKHSKDYVKT